MNARRIVQAILGITFGAMMWLYACSPNPPKIIGTWRNRDKQYLTVGKDLKGKVYQLSPCATPLNVTVNRDPFDSYAIQFVPDQAVYFPPNEQSLFGGAQFFCSSTDSDPMCAFCRIDGKTMGCQSPDQKITGFGATVTHDCTWVQVSTSSTSSITAHPDAGVSCQAAIDAGGCTANLEGPASDAATTAVDGGDAATRTDAGSGDAAKLDS